MLRHDSHDDAAPVQTPSLGRQDSQDDGLNLPCEEAGLLTRAMACYVALDLVSTAAVLLHALALSSSHPPTAAVPAMKPRRRRWSRAATSDFFPSVRREGKQEEQEEEEEEEEPERAEEDEFPGLWEARVRRGRGRRYKRERVSSAALRAVGIRRSRTPFKVLKQCRPSSAPPSSVAEGSGWGATPFSTTAPTTKADDDAAWSALTALDAELGLAADEKKANGYSSSYSDVDVRRMQRLRAGLVALARKQVSLRARRARFRRSRAKTSRCGRKAFLHEVWDANEGKLRRLVGGAKMEFRVAAINGDILDKHIEAAAAKAPDVVFHGSPEKNHESILNSGLLVPGTGGVTVANGQVHGRGIYVAHQFDISYCYSRGDPVFICSAIPSASTKTLHRYRLSVVTNSVYVCPLFLLRHKRPGTDAGSDGRDKSANDDGYYSVPDEVGNDIQAIRLKRRAAGRRQDAARRRCRLSSWSAGLSDE